MRFFFCGNRRYKEKCMVKFYVVLSLYFIHILFHIKYGTSLQYKGYCYFVRPAGSSHEYHASLSHGLTSLFQTKPTIKRTIGTLKLTDEERKETMVFYPEFRTTTRSIEGGTSILNPSFETHVKEFFHFSQRISKKPGHVSSFTTGSTGKITPGSISNKYNKDLKSHDNVFLEKGEEFDIEDSVFDKNEELIDKEHGKDDEWRIVTKDDFIDKYKYTKSPKDSALNEITRNNISENEQGYSTRYHSTSYNVSKQSDETPNNITKIHNDSLIQNDLTGWAITAASPLHYKTFSETSSPWERTWRSTIRKERPINRVTATKIPYHKVTVQSRGRTSYEHERDIQQHSKKYRNEDIGGLESDTIAVGKIYSPGDADELYIKNESPKDKDNVHGNPKDNLESDDTIEWLPVPTAPSPLATKEQWHTALMTTLNSMGPSKRPKNKYTSDVNDFEDISTFDNDMSIPKSIRNSFTGELNELKRRNKNIDTQWSALEGQRNVQPVVPFNAKSFATGQFKTAREYISLIDEDDVSLMSITPTTTTTITTTSVPRSTRKPETFTIGGLLLKGKDDFYQTIGRNPKPILVTPPVTSNNAKNGKSSDKANSIKSVTWATVRPPKELVLNSNPEKNDKANDPFDDNTKYKREEHHNIQKYNTPTLQNKLHRFPKNDKETFDKITKSKTRMHKISSELDKGIVLRRNKQRRNLNRHGAKSSAATIRPPRKTAVVQSKANSSNKDIMYSKFYFKLLNN